MDKDAILLNETETKQLSLSIFENDNLLWWGLSIIYLCIALVAVVGNGLVVYVSFNNRNHGALKHLDCVIQSLAVTDLLFGLIGMPCRIYTSTIATRGLYINNVKFYRS